MMDRQNLEINIRGQRRDLPGIVLQTSHAGDSYFQEHRDPTASCDTHDSLLYNCGSTPFFTKMPLPENVTLYPLHCITRSILDKTMSDNGSDTIHYRFARLGSPEFLRLGLSLSHLLEEHHTSTCQILNSEK